VAPTGLEFKFQGLGLTPPYLTSVTPKHPMVSKRLRDGGVTLPLPPSLRHPLLRAHGDKRPVGER
jgi:hypothetical protein